MKKLWDYFGTEGHTDYWMVAALVTLSHNLIGGLRSSLLTDSAQMMAPIFLLAFVRKAGSLSFHLAF